MTGAMLKLVTEAWPQHRIRVIDAGAMAISGSAPSYEVLERAGMCDVTGFEPNLDELRRLMDLCPDHLHHFLPDVLGDGSTREFKRCRMPSRSSLYEPNFELCDLYNAFSEGSEVVSRTSVQTACLDDLVGEEGADFLKLDVQGAELDVIRGGRRVTASTLVIETEVEFVKQYRDQPTFADVDRELNELGFSFHTVLGYGTRALKPVVVQGDPLRGVNQWLWADVVYVRDVLTWRSLAAERLVSLALIMDAMYNSYDFAYAALLRLDEQGSTQYAQSYASVCPAFEKTGLLHG
jgi:FkbM family methyltransferase